jgi:hypothetical protein
LPVLRNLTAEAVGMFWLAPLAGAVVGTLIGLFLQSEAEATKAG